MSKCNCNRTWTSRHPFVAVRRLPSFGYRPEKAPVGVSSEEVRQQAANGDMADATPVDSRCEHFGLGDGANGGDAYEPYTAARVASLDQMFPDCGGGWQVYWRQSIPGYGNHAHGAGGTPMKNWWPLLFY